MPGKLAISSYGTKSIRGTGFPKDVTLLQSLLGVCNVYLKFVNGFSRIAGPPNNMLKKDSNPDWQIPGDEEEQSFQALKESLIT